MSALSLAESAAPSPFAAPRGLALASRADVAPGWSSAPVGEERVDVEGLSTVAAGAGQPSLVSAGLVGHASLKSGTPSSSPSACRAATTFVVGEHSAAPRGTLAQNWSVRP